jgi:hypothetical protein
VSDLLNEVAAFVDENPNWHEDEDSVAKMVIAYGILTNMSDPSMCSEDECEFVVDIFSKIQEVSK